MKEYTYYLEQFIDGKYFCETFDIHEERREAFLESIIHQIRYNRERYSVLKIAYATDTETLERKEIFVDIVNPLEEDYTRKYALYELNGKEIEMMALADYLQCFSKEFFELKHKTFSDYNYILDSKNILELKDINIENCILSNGFIILYNKKHEVVCRLKLKKRPRNFY